MRDAYYMLSEYDSLTPPDDEAIAQELWDTYYQPLLDELEAEKSGYKTVYDDYLASETAARAQREQMYQDLLGQFNEQQAGYKNTYDDLLARIDAEQSGYTDMYNQMLAALAQEQADTRGLYNNQLQMSTDMYNRNADMLMGNQMRQNAMIQDTLRSDLSRTRQNALEAGASAGLRIAGNINATLAAQNKAAQSSLETSNNLAQMLLNQRQAAAGLRSDYQGYLSDSNRYRNSLQSSQLDRLANSNAQRTSAAYNYNNLLSQLNSSRATAASDYSNWLYNSNQNLANAATNYQNQLSGINSRRASTKANYRNERANEINYQTGVYEDALANAENRIKSRFDDTPISGYISSRLRSNIYK